MKSIFNQADNQELINRIEALTPDMKPVWGKMNAAQMCAHCKVSVDIGIGKIKPNKNLIGIFFGKVALKQMIDKPIKQHLPTGKEFIIPTDIEFEKSKKELIKSYQDLATTGPTMIQVLKHPFFGKMTIEQWDSLLWKHLDHHLRQFGL